MLIEVLTFVKNLHSMDTVFMLKKMKKIIIWKVFNLE